MISRKPMTRQELADYMRVGIQTVYNWTRGWYRRKSTQVFYYEDHAALKPVSGSGKQNDPYRYRPVDAVEYCKNMRLEHLTPSQS